MPCIRAVFPAASFLCLPAFVINVHYCLIQKNSCREWGYSYLQGFFGCFVGSYPRADWGTSRLTELHHRIRKNVYHKGAQRITKARIPPLFPSFVRLFAWRTIVRLRGKIPRLCRLDQSGYYVQFLRYNFCKSEREAMPVL
jgi:hypothetical protein